MSNILTRYRAEFGHIEGWFSDESAALCDILLSHQEEQGLAGDIAEIGVAYGKSALLFGMHSRAGERVLLNDINSPLMEDAARLIRQANPLPSVTTLSQLSTDLRSSDLGKSIRFFHIDGDHGRRACLNDMRLATDALLNEGVIVVDDFLVPQYMGASFAIFKFLAENEIDVALFLAGFNKGYICKRSALPLYLTLVLEKFPKALRSRGIDNFTIFRMQDKNDFNSFGITGRQWDRDFVSLTTDISKPAADDGTIIDIGNGPVHANRP